MQRTLQDSQTSLDWIRVISRRFPHRIAGSQDERLAQQFFAELLQHHCDSVELRPFKTNTNLYLLIGVHFLIGNVGSVCAIWSNFAAATLHTLAAVLYTLDSRKLLFTVRRLLPTETSHNLVAVQEAIGSVRKRIILTAHIDAAREFPMFESRLSRIAARGVPRWFTEIAKPLRLAVIGLIFLACVELIALFEIEAWRFPIAYTFFTVFIAVVCLSNLRFVNRPIVAGANDNLSGCVSILKVAQELEDQKPDDIEMVYVLTGSEEAGNGGAAALAVEMQELWGDENTHLIVVEGVGSGELMLFDEGEVLPFRSDRILTKLLDEYCQFSDGEKLSRYPMPAGSTDNVGFAAAGIRGITLGTTDPKLGMPNNYHSLTDTADEIDENVLNRSAEFVTGFCRYVMQH